MFAVTFREPWVVQKFLPAVKRRRQAHHPGRRRIRRRGQPRAGGRRPALQHGARRRAEGDRADAARARDLRAARAGAARARPAVRRHRRDRRLPHRDQRHLADRHPRHQESRRPRHRGADLGQDRERSENERAAHHRHHRLRPFPRFPPRRWCRPKASSRPGSRSAITRSSRASPSTANGTCPNCPSPNSRRR